jgi:hypothetical protein
MTRFAVKDELLDAQTLRAAGSAPYGTAAEGAGDHCESGARTLFHARVFAWLDPIMKPR